MESQLAEQLSCPLGCRAGSVFTGVGTPPLSFGETLADQRNRSLLQRDRRSEMVQGPRIARTGPADRIGGTRADTPDRGAIGGNGATVKRPKPRFDKHPAPGGVSEAMMRSALSSPRRTTASRRGPGTQLGMRLLRV